MSVGASVWYFACSIMIAAGLAGCTATDESVQLSADQRFQRAMEYFKEEDYLEAIEEFKIVTLQFQGSGIADDAQYYMAECYFMREQYELAAYEYELLLRTMPTSEFVATARYKRALCYFNKSPESFRDQEFTRRAIDEFQSFIEYHPTDSLVQDAERRIVELNTKLAKKEYDNGITYMNMESYKSAITFFDYVLEKYHDSPYAEQAQLKKAEAMMRRKKFVEAKQEIEKFFVKYPESGLKVEAERLRDEILSRQPKPGNNATHEPAAPKIGNLQ